MGLKGEKKMCAFFANTAKLSNWTFFVNYNLTPAAPPSTEHNGVAAGFIVRLLF